MIVDVVLVNSVMCVEWWERGESCGAVVTRQGTRVDVNSSPTSKMLARQVSRGSYCFERGSLKLLYIVQISIICMLCKYKHDLCV